MNTVSAPSAGRLRAFAITSVVLGVIGWFASFELATEYIHFLKDPNYVPNCNISPLVSCSPNMGSWQGSLFGFSNTLIGVAAFMAPILVGFALLAGARFRSWFWWRYILGNLGGIVFIFWLSWQSVFRLGTLCPWCIVVWTIMIPLFWITLAFATVHGYAKTPRAWHRGVVVLAQWAWVIIVLCYLFILVEAQIGVDWISHLRRVLS